MVGDIVCNLCPRQLHFLVLAAAAVSGVVSQRLQSKLVSRGARARACTDDTHGPSRQIQLRPQLDSGGFERSFADSIAHITIKGISLGLNAPGQNGAVRPPRPAWLHAA